MTARYPGTCSRTGARINPGDLIVWEGKGRAYLSDLPCGAWQKTLPRPRLLGVGF